MSRPLLPGAPSKQAAGGGLKVLFLQTPSEQKRSRTGFSEATQMLTVVLLMKSWHYWPRGRRGEGGSQHRRDPGTSFWGTRGWGIGKLQAPCFESTCLKKHAHVYL